MTLESILLESFRRNGRVNAAVLAAVGEADLDTSDGRGGWSVGQHLGHLANFRKDWLSNISAKHADELPDVIGASTPGFVLTMRDPARLAAAFSAGDEAALRAVQDALREGRAFDDPWKEGAYASNPAHFLQHIIVHDSHHRGQVMSLLRQGGRTQEQMNELDEASWPIWRE